MSGLEANSSHCGCRVIASNQLKAAINAKGVSIETMEIVTGGGNNTIYKATDANGKHYAVKCYSHREAVGVTAGIPASCTPSIALNLRLGEFPDSAVTAPVYQIHQYSSQSGFSSETRIAI